MAEKRASKIKPNPDFDEGTADAPVQAAPATQKKRITRTGTNHHHKGEFPGTKGGRPPKFDYDSNDFYLELQSLAMQGMTDAEIAFNLSEKFDETLDPDTFGLMKSGKYAHWTKEQNEQRSERIIRVLARGRQRLNSIVRGTFLKAALGQTTVRSKNTTTRNLITPDGEETDTKVVQTNVGETTGQVNINALSVWLYHHDPEWRKVQRGLDVGEEAGVPQDIEHGIEIDAWVRKEVEDKKAGK